MSRLAARCLALAVLALAPAAQAQLHTHAPGPSAPGLSSPRHHGPVHPLAPAPAKVQAQPAAARPPDQQCVPGSQGCLDGAQRGGALIVPVRSSTELVQPGASGAVPAATVSSGAMLPGAPPTNLQQPMPRQPLSDVLGQSPTIRITIRAISAGRQGSALEIDGRLGPIDRDLRSFADQFSYRSYRLIDVQTFDLDFRSIAQMELPGGRAIEVEPRQFGPDGRVKVHLELLGQHPEHTARMRTDTSIPRGRTILVGGYRIDPAAPESGTLLLAITQDQ